MKDDIAGADYVERINAALQELHVAQASTRQAVERLRVRVNEDAEMELRRETQRRDRARAGALLAVVAVGAFTVGLFLGGL